MKSTQVHSCSSIWFSGMVILERMNEIPVSAQEKPPPTTSIVLINTAEQAGTLIHHQPRNSNVSPRKGKIGKRNSWCMNSLRVGGEEKGRNNTNMTNTNFPALTTPSWIINPCYWQIRGSRKYSKCSYSKHKLKYMCCSSPRFPPLIFCDLWVWGRQQIHPFIQSPFSFCFQALCKSAVALPVE